MTRSSAVSRQGGAHRALRLMGVAGIVLVIGSGVASGQPAPPPPAPSQPPPADAPLTQQVNIPPAEQATRADEYLGRMEQVRSTVRRQLQDAREKKDLVKQICLNDKLSQVDTAIKTANDRHDDLAAAVKLNDSGQSTYEFTIITTLKQRTDQLQVEANQCLGEEVGRADDKASVKTTVTGLPSEDPSEYPSFTTAQQIPGCTSCVL
jgi:hypothetical protein